MPQSNEEIHDYDLRSDMRSYYRGSIVTYVQPAKDQDSDPVRHAAYIDDFRGTNRDLKADIRTLPRGSGGWSAAKTVPIEALEFTLPALGLVAVGTFWFHLSRHPARRMRKGYHVETVQASCLSGRDYEFHCEINATAVVRQVWYGNEDRITANIVVWDKDIYYTTDKVASLDNEGNVVFIPNKEKLGEFVCKALANNWDLATSKYSVRALPSSPMMPLV